MRSEAATVGEYLDSLQEGRREAVAEVRDVVAANLPGGYVEAMNWGMITWQVPLERYPNTYNKQPLMYAALASQKNYMSLYLTSIYMDEDEAESFEARYRATGKRYDVGKSCVRFRTVDDLPLDLVAETIAATPVDAFIDQYEQARA